MIPLGLLSPGERGEIRTIRTNLKAVSEQCCSEREKCDCRVEDMGLRVGKFIEMLTNGDGPVLVRVDESRIALDRGLEEKGALPGRVQRRLRKEVSVVSFYQDVQFMPARDYQKEELLC